MKVSTIFARKSLCLRPITLSFPSKNQGLAEIGGKDRCNITTHLIQNCQQPCSCILYINQRKEMTFLLSPGYMEIQQSNCEKIKAWVTFPRTTNDTNDLILVLRFIDGKRWEMSAQHKWPAKEWAISHAWNMVTFIKKIKVLPNRGSHCLRRWINA